MDETESTMSPEPGFVGEKSDGNPPPCGKVPLWHLHRRLYHWILHWSETPYGGPALFVMSLAESSFFPIPPDVLLMPLVLGNRRKWFWFAFWCSLASVIGGALGYLIGMTVWGAIDQTVFAWHIPGINEANFAKATSWYEQYNFWIVFAAGFTPLPYKVATISAGMFFGPSLPMFIIFMLASATSRTARFFLVAGLMGRYGPTIKPFIDKYFNLLCFAFVILLIGGFAIIKYLG
ncbi:MAG: YqaA family protein [Planctomycetota bacterium]|jgi:membrane protein YqaA with SNARE-associated domain